MGIAVFFLMFIFWCAVFAKLETEIEGSNGWAKELPTSKYIWEDSEGKMYHKELSSTTFRLVDHTTWPGNFFHFYINTILGGKDFTVYHRVIDIMQLFVAHVLVYLCFMAIEPWWVLELRAFASLFLIWSIEDTLWFYINPCASQSGHHKDWIMIGKYRIMEKGMSINFILGTVLMTLSFFLVKIINMIF